MSAGGSPRQKMINMMYLVLIALLALNVSKEILKAFNLMEVSFENSKKNIDGKNDAVMKVFQKNMQDQAAKTKPWLDKAEAARKISKDFCTYVEDLRKKLETATGGRKEHEEGQDKSVLTELMMPDNMERHANYFVVENNGANGKKVQSMINDTRNALLKLLDDPNLENSKQWIAEFDKATALRAEDPKEHGGATKHTWVGMYLEHSPLAGVMAMLSKYQNDCKNLEADVLNVLLSQINAKDFKFDALQAKLIPIKGTMILEGEQYEAEVILSAYNSKENHQMTVNGAAIEVKDGVGKFKQTASEGDHKLKGQVLVKSAEGVKPYDFEGEYMGFKSSATIAADKMNVLYVGLDNPVSVSVPGFPPENVKPVMAGGTLIPTGKKGSYMASVPAGVKEVTITANVTTKGSTKAMGNVKFRVKNVPKPLASFGIKQGGTIKAVEVGTTSFITCGLGPEFAFEGMNYSVTKFNLTYIPKKGDAFFGSATGNSLNGQMKSVLAKARKGDMITVYNIEAMGPGKIGLVKIPTAIALTVE